MPGTRLTVLAVLGLIGATTAAHGLASGRWAEKAVPSIPEVPKVLGAWRGEDQKSDLNDPEQANLTRKYVHARTGKTVVISLTVGHPGLTAVHTPEFCYRGSGYDVGGAVEVRTVPGIAPDQARFWTTTFRKNAPGGADSLRILWAWSADGPWSAPDYPRLRFMGKSSLYKLYIVCSDGPDAPTPDQLDEFLTALLDTLHRALFAPPVA